MLVRPYSARRMPYAPVVVLMVAPMCVCTCNPHALQDACNARALTCKHVPNGVAIGCVISLTANIRVGVMLTVHGLRSAAASLHIGTHIRGRRLPLVCDRRCTVSRVPESAKRHAKQVVCATQGLKPESLYAMPHMLRAG